MTQVTTSTSGNKSDSINDMDKNIFLTHLENLVILTTWGGAKGINTLNTSLVYNKCLSNILR